MGCPPAVADLLRARGMRLHADHKVEKLFTLNNLRGRLAAHCRLHNGFHIRNVDAVASDFSRSTCNHQAGLAQFAHDGQFGKARICRASLIFRAFS